MNVHRRLGHSPIDAPIAALLVCLALALLPVVRWNLALPKIAGILTGCALALLLARLPVRFRPFLGPGLVLLSVGIVLGGIFVVNWPTDKLPGLSRIGAMLLAVPSPLRRSVHPNQIGGVVALLLPIALATVLASGKGRRWRIVAGLATCGLLGGSILVSQSRGALLGVLFSLVGLVGWLVWGGRRRTSTLMVGLAAVAVAGLTIVLLDGWRGGDDSLATFGGRQALWLRGLLMVADAPLTGIGIGQFPALLTTAYPMFAAEVDTSLPHVHNWFLQIAIDLGVPGLLVICWLLWRIAKGLAVSAGQGSVMAAGMLAGLGAYLLYGLTDASALGAIGGLVFWVVIGSGAAWTNASQPLPPEVEEDGGPCRELPQPTASAADTAGAKP